ncbi:MAG: ABC transporter permease [Firmicutes bacterium]|nr:ABC transporter permease [Bacillota bacterium]
MKARIAAAPYLLWAALFIVVPMGLVGYYALTDMNGGFTLDNFVQGMRFAPVIGSSVWLAIIATALCLAIAYPLAYLISRKSANTQRTLVLLVMLPMWMNFLLRTYAWMTLLENNGVINRLLGMIGLGPYEMINTQGAVVLGMVYNYLPFMILPLYSVMTKIEPSLIEAATDLGCSPGETLRQVVLPLSLPGIATGITMVFVPSVSTFVISVMLGGGSFMLIGDLIEMQFLGNAYNPNLGAALSLVLMVILLVCMALTDMFHNPEEKEGLLL